jgi:hypothetical protein
MFTPEQYRAKAVEYSELVKKSTRPKPAPRSVCRQSISDSWLGNLREYLAHLV